MGHEGLHESGELLSEQAKDFHRAVVSLIEELEAIDWYQQRADATQEESLKAIVLHNLNEEVEHAMMLLEWLRRRHAKLDESARTYLFTDRPITEIEKEEEAGDASAPVASSGRSRSRQGVAQASPGCPGHGQGPLQVITRTG